MGDHVGALLQVLVAALHLVGITFDLLLCPLAFDDFPRKISQQRGKLYIPLIIIGGDAFTLTLLLTRIPLDKKHIISYSKNIYEHTK